jgi:hypothetical protein
MIQQFFKEQRHEKEITYRENANVTKSLDYRVYVCLMPKQKIQNLLQLKLSIRREIFKLFKHLYKNFVIYSKSTIVFIIISFVAFLYTPVHAQKSNVIRTTSAFLVCSHWPVGVVIARFLRSGENIFTRVKKKHYRIGSCLAMFHPNPRSILKAINRLILSNTTKSHSHAPWLTKNQKIKNSRWPPHSNWFFPPSTGNSSSHTEKWNRLYHRKM